MGTGIAQVNKECQTSPAPACTGEPRETRLAQNPFLAAATLTGQAADRGAGVQIPSPWNALLHQVTGKRESTKDSKW